MKNDNLSTGNESGHLAGTLLKTGFIIVASAGLIFMGINKYAELKDSIRSLFSRKQYKTRSNIEPEKINFC